MSRRDAIERLQKDVAALLRQEGAGTDRDRFVGYADRLDAFATEVIGAKLEPYQADWLRAITTQPRVAIKTAHGVGKSWCLAVALVGWLLTRPMSRVAVVTPALRRQGSRYLFGTVRQILRESKVELPLQVLTDTVEVVGYKDWAAILVQSQEADKVEGLHSEAGVLILADEARSLGSVLQGLQGAMTSDRAHNCFMMASVPGASTGPFFEAFQRPDLWKTFSVSAYESDRVSDQWIEDREKAWGRASPLFTSKVEARFISEADDTLYGYSLLEQAMEKPAEVEGPVVLGVDVARFGGDRSVTATWRGASLVKLETKRGKRTTEVGAWVSSLINRSHAEAAVVDTSGMPGVADKLWELGHGDVTIEFMAQQRALRSDLFANRMAEVAWELREALEKGEVSLPKDDNLLAELASYRYDIDPKGRITLKDKRENSPEASPDLGDAAILGFSGVTGSAFASLDVPEDSVVWSTPAWGEVFQGSPGGLFQPGEAQHPDFVGPEDDGWDYPETVFRTR